MVPKKKTIEIEKTIDRENLIYKASEYTYSFRNFWTIRKFGRDIHEGQITLKEADKDKSNLLTEIMKFNNKTRPQNDNKKEEKEIVYENLKKFLEARERLLDGFESKIFLIKSIVSGLLNTDHSKLKIVTPKQMLQRLPIALSQVNASNKSESLWNEIRQIAKKVYNNIIKSLQWRKIVFNYI